MFIKLMAPRQAAVNAIKSAGRRKTRVPGAPALLLTDAIKGIHISIIAKQGGRLKSNDIL
jgi:hypothetical protein